MIAIATTDAWETASITLDDGSGPQVFFPMSTNARDVADEFRDWVDDTFDDAALWLWARDPSSGGALVVFSLPLGYTMTTNAAAQSILGAAAAGGPGMTATVWTAPAGSIVPPTPIAGAYVDNRFAAETTRGAASGVGVARASVPGMAATSMRVRWPAYAVDMERVRAAQQNASSPRQAHIYDSAYGWMLVSLGPVRVVRSGLKLWRVSAEVLQ